MIFNHIKKKLSVGLRVIDILGILIFLLSLSVLLLFLLRKGRFVDVVIRVTDIDIFTPQWTSESRAWYLDSINVGMAQFDNLGQKNIEVVEKKIYPTNQTSRIADITLRIRAVYNKRTKKYLYQGEPLLVGERHMFKLNSLVIRGLLRDVDSSILYAREGYIIKGYLSPLFNNFEKFGAWGSFTGTPNTTGVPNYLANDIDVGEIVKDSKGEVVALVRSVEKRPAVFVLAETLPYQVADTRMTEVLIEVELQAEVIGDKPLYLGIQPLVLGQLISLHFADKSIHVVVTEVEKASTDE